MLKALTLWCSEEPKNCCGSTGSGRGHLRLTFRDSIGGIDSWNDDYDDDDDDDDNDNNADDDVAAAADDDDDDDNDNNADDDVAAAAADDDAADDDANDDADDDDADADDVQVADADNDAADDSDHLTVRYLIFEVDRVWASAGHGIRFDQVGVSQCDDNCDNNVCHLDDHAPGIWNLSDLLTMIGDTLVSTVAIYQLENSTQQAPESVNVYRHYAIPALSVMGGIVLLRVFCQLLYLVIGFFWILPTIQVEMILHWSDLYR